MLFRSHIVPTNLLLRHTKQFSPMINKNGPFRFRLHPPVNEGYHTVPRHCAQYVQYDYAHGESQLMRNQLPSCSEHEYSAWQVYPTSGTCHIPAKCPTWPLAGCFSFLPASHLRFKIVFRMAKRALFLFQLPPALSVQIHTARTDVRRRCFKHTAQTSDHTQRSVHWAEPVPLRTPLQQTLCEFVSKYNK